ncbi:MAG: HEPN domain-containing protein, partial [Chloroflexota bacterium]
LSYALGDLSAARAQRGRHVRPRIVAFHAQQAAEKALKAALVLSDIEPARRHDLEELRNGLTRDWRVKEIPADLTRLSRYGVAVRYPDDFAAVSALQSATAVRQAMAVVRLVRQDFERRGVPTEGLEPR